MIFFHGDSPFLQLDIQHKSDADHKQESSCKSYTDVEKNAVFSFTRIHNHTAENGKQDAQDYHGFSPFV